MKRMFSTSVKLSHDEERAKARRPTSTTHQVSPARNPRASEGVEYPGSVVSQCKSLCSTIVTSPAVNPPVLNRYVRVRRHFVCRPFQSGRPSAASRPRHPQLRRLLPPPTSSSSL